MKSPEREKYSILYNFLLPDAFSSHCGKQGLVMSQGAVTPSRASRTKTVAALFVWMFVVIVPMTKFIRKDRPTVIIFFGNCKQRAKHAAFWRATVLYSSINVHKTGETKLKKTQTDAAISTTVSVFSTQAHLPTYRSVCLSICLSLPSSVY